MLPRNNRLSRVQLQSLKAHNFKKTSSFFILLANPNKLSHSRFGVTISAKLLKTAVARNKLRRQIFSISRGFTHKPQNFDIIIIPKHTSLKLNYSQLKSKLTQNLNQVYAYKTNNQTL